MAVAPINLIYVDMTRQAGVGSEGCLALVVPRSFVVVGIDGFLLRVVLRALASVVPSCTECAAQRSGRHDRRFL